jgi:plastocyanin
VCRPRHAPNPPTSTTTAATTTSTTPTAPLPSRLEVDENDQGQPPQPYSLWPSHNPVAAGKVQFNVYNFGQDPHTFAIVDSGGRQLAYARALANQPQTAVSLSVELPAGTYTLECTLSGHASLGMVATLTVK